MTKHLIGHIRHYKYGVVGLLAVVFITVVAAAIRCPQEDSESAVHDEARAIPVHRSKASRSNPDHVTECYFPESARSDNQDVNLFMSDFIDVLLGENYKTYRQMVTRRRRPYGEKPFDRIHYRARRVDILKVEPVENMLEANIPELRDVEPPIYRVKIHVDLRDNTAREFYIYIFREDNQWVSSH